MLTGKCSPHLIEITTPGLRTVPQSFGEVGGIQLVIEVILTENITAVGGMSHMLMVLTGTHGKSITSR